MGDSITDGWKLARFFPGKPYVNRGISGQTTPHYFGAMVDEKGLMKDGLSREGLHPNDKGYEVMAPVAAAAIRQALGQ